MNEEGGRRPLLSVEGMVGKMVDVIIRLPPLYMMDYILLNNMGVWTDPTLQRPATNLPNETESINITEQIEKKSVCGRLR